MTTSSAVHRILLTPGEPAGVGPELVVRIAQSHQTYELTAVADPDLLHATANQLGLPLKLRECNTESAPVPTEAGELCIVPQALAQTAVAGELNITNAQYVLDTLTRATELCLEKKAGAIVTGPVQKSIINDAGIRFSGHTEFFAELSNTPKVVMMLATDNLRVSLATTHLPLKDVSAAITKDSLREVITILINDLRIKFGIAKPHILVCGLNPHAGEGGHLGFEEIDTIIPVLDEFKDQNVTLEGPLPADTLFTPHHLDGADAVLAMYHDQGLPVLKYQGFGRAVNITLGLPFIRTSVDHGTALNIAGKGLANDGSLIEALKCAHQLCESQVQHG